MPSARERLVSTRWRPGRRAPSFAAVLLCAAGAHAALYENAVLVDDEDDLFTLQQRGDISAEQLDTLLELLREGVELNSASRDQLYELPGLTYADVDAILEYRKAKGRIDDPAELVGAGALTAEQLLQAAPFLRIDAAPGPLPFSAKLRAVSQAASADVLPPPGLLIARVKAPRGLSAGAMFATSRRLPATPRYEPALDALVSAGPRYAVHLPRVFAQWQAARRRVVVGTYTIGFGERLTLDNTSHAAPRGLYLTDDFVRPAELSSACRVTGAAAAAEPACATGAKSLYVTPDYTWREVFRGAAASLEEVPVGGGVTASAYGFLSWQSRSVSQYELYDRRACDDPRDPSAACAAPPVYLDEGAATGATKVATSSLPHLFDELAGGGHVDVRPLPRLRVGVTAWGGWPVFRQTPLELGFQEWSRYPSGGAYGAAGLDAQLGVGAVNLFGEVSRSFDREPGGGGGLGALVRGVWNPKGHELELSLRYYDTKLANPYARPVSAPDEYDGRRAANELGARVRYFGRLSADWQVRGLADFWLLPHANPRLGPAGMANLWALARVDFTGWDVFQPAAWVDARDRNLSSSQRGRCTSGDVVYVEGDPGFACSGDLYRVALRLQSTPVRRFTAVLQGALTWLDDVRYRDRLRQDVLLWGELRAEPVDWLQLRLKSRYLFQDTSDNTYLEQSWWTFFQATWRVRKGTSVAVRYDLFVWLDRRDSTPARVPSPEHRVLLDARVEL